MFGPTSSIKKAPPGNDPGEWEIWARCDELCSPNGQKSPQLAESGLPELTRYFLRYI